MSRLVQSPSRYSGWISSRVYLPGRPRGLYLTNACHRLLFTRATDQYYSWWMEQVPDNLRGAGGIAGL